MKKLFIVSFFVLFIVSASWAQKREGEFSFIPRVGLNLSNLGDMDFYANSSDKEIKSKTRPDFMLGADVEYQVMSPLSVSIGAFYSRQGCRWADFSEVFMLNKDKWTDTMQDQAVTLQYINVPLSAKLYANQYVALHAGLQVGFALASNWHSVNTTLIEHESGTTDYDSTESNTKVTKLNPVVFSIPLGVSLEYDKVIIDVNYNIPLSRFSNMKVDEVTGSHYLFDGGNQVLNFSVGYRL